jgi:RNA polymerase sigma-70 factor (ECF subfamily)
MPIDPSLMNRMEGNDAAVVAQVLAGDEDAYRMLVERHSRSIFRLAYRMTVNEQDAEDVVQETFLRAYRQLKRFESRSNFGTWLYRIAVNCSLDLIRKRRRHDDHSSDPLPQEEVMLQLKDEAPTPDRVVLGAEIKKRVDSVLATLGPKERAAFSLRHFEGMSIEEIGLVLGLRPGAIKNNIFRAVQKLRRELQPVVHLTP